jgi:DNA-binding NarL/FixJ family response regulator
VTSRSRPRQCPPGRSTWRRRGSGRDLHGLTPRELEVLGLLVEGWPNHAIAADLGITDRTVAAHVEHIVAKLGAPSRTLAAVSAWRRGLFVPRMLHRGPLPGEPAGQ